MTVLPISSRRDDHQKERGDRASRTEELSRCLRECWDAAESERLRHELALVNLGVARSVASRYSSRSVSPDDLRQVAYLALFRAALKFDPRSGHDFLSYGVPTVRGEIQRYFRDQDWTIRLPRRIQELRRDVLASEERLAAERGHEVSTREVAEHLNLEIVEVERALVADAERPLSLEHPVATDGAAVLGDLLGVQDETRAGVEARAVLAPAVRALTDRDRRILLLRFFHGATQQEIAADIGVTQMQVSRILSRIFRDLRRAIDPDGSREVLAD